MVEESVDVQNPARLVMNSQVNPGDRFHELLEGAEPAGQHDHGVGEIGHPRLPLVHRPHDLEAGETLVGDLMVGQRLGDHAGRPAAGGEDGIGNDCPSARPRRPRRRARSRSRPTRVPTARAAVANSGLIARGASRRRRHTCGEGHDGSGAGQATGGEYLAAPSGCRGASLGRPRADHGLGGIDCRGWTGRRPVAGQGEAARRRRRPDDRPAGSGCAMPATEWVAPTPMRTVERTATPTALPTCRPVLNRVEARPGVGRARSWRTTRPGWARRSAPRSVRAGT